MINWPTQSNTFVGRRQELAELDKLLLNPACRLLTLVGPGGIGKTRLALAAAERHAADYADGVCFIPCQGVESGTDLATMVADALHLAFRATENPLQQLLGRLQDQRLLLVFDNVEHLLVEEAGKGSLIRLLTGLIQTSPALKLIVTSRTVIHIREEWVFRVDGLQLAAEKAGAASEAVDLFVQRAQRTGAEITVARERDAIQQICHHVGGHPLALELAASWADTLSCRDIAYEIERTMDLLVSRASNVPSRHVSIRAVFDQSWARLNAEERAMLRRLAVFYGSFTLAAAKSVAGASLASLATLIDRSLLRRTANGRYELHELLHQYAAEQLDDTPEERTQIVDQHARFYLEYVCQLIPELQGRGQKEAVQLLNVELQNVMGAWRRAVAMQDANLLMAATVGLIQFCDVSGRFQDGLTLFRLATKRYGDDANVHCFAHLQAGEGMCLLRIGRLSEAIALLDQSVQMLREIPEDPGVSLPLALSWLAHVYFFQARYDLSKRAFQESAHLYRQLEDSWGVGLSLLSLGLVVRYQDLLNEAESYIAEAEALLGALGEQRIFAMCVFVRGGIAFIQGDYPRARQSIGEALTIQRSLDDVWGIGYSTRDLGYVAIAQGDYADAEAYLNESLEAFTTTGATASTLFPLDALGTISRLRGDYVQAESYHRRALSISVELNERRGEALTRLNLGRLAMLGNDTAGAEELLCTSLDIFSQIGNQIGAASVANVLGVLLGTQLGRRCAAGAYFHQALDVGDTCGIPPILLEAFLGVATILLTTAPAGHPHWIDAVSLLALVQTHLASTQEMQQRATEQLDGIVPVEKTVEPLDLDAALAIVRTVVAGWAQDAPTPITAASPSEPSAMPEWIEPLTAREMDVLRLIEQGRTNREIAEHLIFTLGTVKWYTNQIYSKLGVANRSEAAHTARRYGLLA